MQSCLKSPGLFRTVCFATWMLAGALAAVAGVSRTIQEQYKRDYENKALFLKIPIHTERQRIHISGQSFRVEQGSGTPRFRVGDRLRVLLVDFAGDEIKFKMSGIETAGFVEIAFKFDESLQDDFPNKDVFDRALRSTLTEGLKYTDIEDAQQTFVRQQFERSVGDIAGAASISRESVLKNIALQVPAYQDAQREIENLRNSLQDVSGQLSQSQSESRKRESELRALQAEFARLKSEHSALQEKIDSSAHQVSRLGEELRDARGNAQGYQRELASIQRSLNLKVDANRDLTAQIADLGQAMRKQQKENESLAAQIGSLQNGLDAQRASNERLLKENDELKSGNRQMQNTINTLTSKEDSLARQYLNLKAAKEKLDVFSQSVRTLRARVTGEKTEGLVRHGKADVFLDNVLLGSLDWSIPVSLNPKATAGGEASFTAESIDYVRVTPEERQLLRSLGDRLKMRVDLVPDSATMAVRPAEKESIREIGERDRTSWHWDIHNQGTQDARLLLTARVINRNADEIPVLQKDCPVASSNIVRQARNHLRPIPLALGAVIGFLLFGIVGIFRRAKGKHAAGKQDTAGSSDPDAHTGLKQL